MSRRETFSPEPSTSAKHGGAVKPGRNKTRPASRIWRFKLPDATSFSVGRFFKNVGEKMAKALPPWAAAERWRCSRRVSSATLARSQSYAGTLDSQRAEAIEDCIEFLNSSSSSSLQRSNSVSSSCEKHMM